MLADGSAVSGDAVNLCARVAASSPPGELRLTRAAFVELPREHKLNCRSLGPMVLDGFATPIELLALEWRDETQFPRSLRIEETGERLNLPRHDIVTFGRLPEHNGARANDIVLAHPDPAAARQISRWHFELRRFADGFHLRPLSDGATEVDGTLIAKGQEVVIKPGSRIRVANVITLTFASPPIGDIPDHSDSTMLSGLPTR